MKEKVSELKERLADQEGALERAAEDTRDMKGRYDGALHTLREDMRRVKSEWEARLEETELEHARQKTEALAKHRMQVEALKRDFQELLDTKLLQLHSENETRAERALDESNEMRAVYEARLEEL